jgi:hypothetical protein
VRHERRPSRALWLRRPRSRETKPTSALYQKRRPEEGLLHRILRDHLPAFFGAMEEVGTRLPRNVRRELDEYLRCGILAHGFIRGECERCRSALLLAFSCKRCTVCPSCGAKRMAIEAAHLVDRVIPEVPVRQWVLSLPFDLRFLLAQDRSLLSPFLRIFIDVIFTRYRRGADDADAQCGAVYWFSVNATSVSGLQHRRASRVRRGPSDGEGATRLLRCRSVPLTDYVHELVARLPADLLGHADASLGCILADATALVR